MTERLYYTDSYLRDFEATVTERADGGRRIYLDRTAFYPTSGGQPFDTGRLGGIQVLDVVDEGDRVAHLMEGSLSESRVAGQVDWARRFDHMQQHTGQHLLSAVFADLTRHSTVGVHFGRDSSTLDLDAVELSSDLLVKVESRTNEVVVENRPVEVSFEDANRANGLRKVSDRSGTLRIVTIHDLDRSACGGTHVRATGEIGAILIRKLERARRGVRIEFLCGQRATRRARADYDILSRMASQFSASVDEVSALVEAQRTELKDANTARRELGERIEFSRARELYDAVSVDAAGIRKIYLRLEQGSIDSLRGLAQALISLPRAIFIGTVPSPPAVLLAASADSGIDAAGVLRGLLASVGGRGGGSARVAQGIVPGQAQLDAIVAGLGASVGSAETRSGAESRR